jgi:hypothetical protein
MRKESLRIDLTELARSALYRTGALIDELEGCTKELSASPAWSARFIALGEKQAASRH